MCYNKKQVFFIVYVHLPTEVRDRSVGILFETNSDGAYRWHLRITQVDCSRGIYTNRFTRNLPYKFVGKQVSARMTRSTQSRDFLLDTKDENAHIDLMDSFTNHTRRQKRSFLITTEASLRVTPSAPTGCLQYHTSRYILLFISVTCI